MPAYRITKPLPVVLNYRGTSYTVSTFEGVYSVWNLAARKEPPVPYNARTLFSAPNKPAFDRALADGFEVPDGGAEQRIMDSLCRVGYAERLPF